MLKQLFYVGIFLVTFSIKAKAQVHTEILKKISYVEGKYPLLIINQTVQQFSIGLFDKDPEKGGKLVCRSVINSGEYVTVMLPINKKFVLVTHQVTDLIETRKLSLPDADNKTFKIIRTANNLKTIFLEVLPYLDKESGEPHAKTLYVFNRVVETHQK